ncbi:MAG: acyl-CoA thioesterase, partial [Actinomycetota bacterium]|nr:acyl-CoA thioesterase [Actinomycetota bacterium]
MHSVAGYPYAQVVPTRWNDNDAYGHVNNTVHYLAMDTVINAWL